MTVVGYTRKSVAKDIAVVAANMRAADAAEINAGSGETPATALLYCFMSSSPAMTICKADGTPVAMWGVVRDNNEVGRVWLLGTDDLVQDKAMRLRFLREAKLFLNDLFRTYKVLWNCVDARNKVHIRWIQWMGFTFVAKHPNYGAEGRLFLEFCQVSRHV